MICINLFTDLLSHHLRSICLSASVPPLHIWSTQREIDRRIRGEEGREEEAPPSKEKTRRRSSKKSSGWRQLKTLKMKEKIMLTGKRLQLQDFSPTHLTRPPF
ncbi:hypothetical protein ABKV19_010891 [Rosa sericea]